MTANFTLTILTALLLAPLAALFAAEPGSAEPVIRPAAVDVVTETWRAAEITFESAKAYADPLNDAEVNAIFTSPSGRAYTVPGFWDGGRTWRVRFAPPERGVWTFVTACTDSTDGGLRGKTGTLRANPYQGTLDIYRRGFLRTEPGARYFMYADGTPFFYLGDTHWSMPMEPFEEMFTRVVDTRVAQGFTVYQSQPLGAKFQFADGLGEADLHGLQDLDRRFKYIAGAGLVHANAQLFFPPEISKPCYTDAYLKKLCRMWVARFGAYPVLWTSGQEVDNDFYFDRGDQNGFDAKSNPWKKVLAWVHEYDPYRHPGTAHMEFLGGAPEPETFPPKNERPNYGYGVQASTSSFRDVPGHTWYAVQWTPPHESGIHWRPMKDFWENGQGKPVVNYEGSYDHLWTLGDGARQQGWTAYLNGMFGHGYGAIDIWFYRSTYDMEKDTVRGSLTITVEQKKTAWTTSVEFPSARELGLHMKAFFTSLEWWRLTPRFDDRKWFMPENTAWHSLATIDADLYVLYLCNRTTTATGVLCNLRDSAHTAQWFDPRTGAYLDLGTFTPEKDAPGEGGRWRIPAKPSAADWVLLVKASPGGRGEVHAAMPQPKDAQPAEPDIVLADFEQGYCGWQTKSEAFDHSTTRPRPGTPPTGFNGKGLADSWDGDQQILAGTLTSPEYVIQRPFIRALVGGWGVHPGCSLQVFIDGKLEYWAAGAGDRELRPVAFDVSAFLGHKVRFEATDPGQWSYIMVDDVVATKTPGAKTPILYSVSQCVALDKEMDLAGMRYLHLPINNLAQPVHCDLLVDGQPAVDLRLRLAIDVPVQWWASYPLDNLKGKKLRIRSRMPAVYNPHADAFTRLLCLAPEPRDVANIYREPGRPQLHFTQQRGQNNDPNGLFYYQGLYHLFYQHNPVGLEFGSQVWGHASSPDLFHWTEHPIALWSGYQWQAFSGSGVVDKHNDSGLKQGSEDPILLFYSQNGRSATCVAYSIDGGKTYQQYAKNPLFLTRHPAGHDPKVVWSEKDRKWVMIIHDQLDGQWGFDFYESRNLLDWKYLSTSPGWFETPDLFPMALDGDLHNVKWIVHECGGNYRIGDFNGREFVPLTEKQRTFHGSFHAAQTFNNAPNGRTILMAATPSFNYHRDDPAMPVIGGMVIPLEATLRTSPAGPRLYLNPAKEIETLISARQEFPKAALSDLSAQLTGIAPGLFDIEFEWDASGSRDFQLKVWDRELFAFTSMDMSCAVNDQKRKVEPVNGKIKVRLICDRSLVSFYVNDGYEAGNCYLAGFRPECRQALTLQGAEDQVFHTFSVRTIRPTRPAAAKESQRTAQP